MILNSVFLLIGALLSSFLLNSWGGRWQTQARAFSLALGQGVGEAEVYVPTYDLHLCCFRQKHQKRSQKRKISEMKWVTLASLEEGAELWAETDAVQWLSSSPPPTYHLNVFSLTGLICLGELTLHPHVVLQVLQFNTNCPECNAPAQTNMKLVRIFCQAVGLFLIWLRHEDYIQAEEYSLHGKHIFYSKW